MRLPLHLSQRAMTLVFALSAAALVCACASKASPPAVSVPPAKPAAPVAPLAVSTPAPPPVAKAPVTEAPPQPPKQQKAAARAPTEVRTRNAVFKLASYDDLPGWQQDDMRASWSAFRNSCDVLRKRDEWRDICSEARSVPPSTRAMRNFFESRFTLLRILNTDATREGDVTGYFEPLLEGQPHRDAEFDTPVMGVPRDLYTIDWSRIPKSQRRGTVRVRTDGNLLITARSGDAATYALDLRRFDLDDRDRRLRVRLVGSPGSASAQAEPYYTRGELEALGIPGGVDAPVLTWVNDPLALYAMQVQGSGRIRLPDGHVLRLQYAEQNGHPFKPLRVRAKPRRHVATRGIEGPGVADEAMRAADEFEIEGDPSADSDAAEPELLTRGARPAKRPPPPASSVDPLVEELLRSAHKTPPSPPEAAVSKKADRPATPTFRPNSGSRLSADPSYVFFKAVDDRPTTEGPQGALGVPLTPGRSVAVDPRVTPLGYPVFLSAPAPPGSSISMQRLVFAQDTGGAIRGAVRADYFWGFGSEAGQMARSTRHRGQMWVLLPTAEASRLTSSKLLTRGLGQLDGSASETLCLVPDGEFCAEVD